MLKGRMLGGPRENGYFVSDNRAAVEIPKETAARAFVAAGLVPPHPLDAWRGRRGHEGEAPWEDAPEYEERTAAMLEDLRHVVHDTGIEIQLGIVWPVRIRVLLMTADDPRYLIVASRYWPLLRKAEQDAGLRTRGEEQPIVGYTSKGLLRLVMPLRVGVGESAELGRLISPIAMAQHLGLSLRPEEGSTQSLPKEG